MIFRPLITIALAVSVLLAGCTGTLAEFASSPASLPDADLGPAGYVHVDTLPVPMTYPIGIGPVYRDVRVTAWVSGYAKVPDGTAVDGAETLSLENDTAVLVLLSTPDEKFEGQSLNPFAHLSDRELLVTALDILVEAQAIGGVGDVSGLREVSVAERTVLGQSTQVVTFAGVAELDGESVSVLFHVAVVPHGDDVIVAIGAHERTVDESATIAALIERIEHEAKER